MGCGYGESKVAVGPCDPSNLFEGDGGCRPVAVAHVNPDKHFERRTDVLWSSGFVSSGEVSEMLHTAHVYVRLRLCSLLYLLL